MFGFDTAVFFTHASRLLRHGMADISQSDSPLRASLDRAAAQADRIARHSGIAA